ncbi:MAG: DUF6776 family protein, partial [Salinisphaeraceae bacterium]|nr:DUF6776 family protein [Salinisphaeraceae bacterium]
DESKAGMRVYELEIAKQDDEPGRYSFDLMLIQAVRHHRRVGGRVDMSIQGVQGGEEVTLSARDMGLSRPERLNYSFRYFQEIRGSFRLPEGFAPLAVTVTVSSSNGSASSFDRQFSWSEVLKTSGENDVGQEQG